MTSKSSSCISYGEDFSLLRAVSVAIWPLTATGWELPVDKYTARDRSTQIAAIQVPFGRQAFLRPL